MSIEVYESLEFGFYGIKYSNITIQVCLQERKDKKGYKKCIDKNDCGHNDGICGDINKEALEKLGSELTLEIILKAARKSGYKIK